MYRVSQISCYKTIKVGSYTIPTIFVAQYLFTLYTFEFVKRDRLVICPGGYIASWSAGEVLKNVRYTLYANGFSHPLDDRFFSATYISYACIMHIYTIYLHNIHTHIVLLLYTRRTVSCMRNYYYIHTVLYKPPPLPPRAAVKKDICRRVNKARLRGCEFQRP